MFDLNLPPKNNNIEIKTDKVMHVKNATNFSYYTPLGKTQIGARGWQPKYLVTPVSFCLLQATANVNLSFLSIPALAVKFVINVNIQQ
jgi:hypothetical protein